MVLAVATSCGDDEDDYAPDNVNDPEKLTDPLPTTDQLGVTHNNTLYYLSFWSKEDHMISENMINRYKEAVPYAPGKKMEVGDAFFFTRQDIDRIQSDTDLLADIKDMFHKRSIVMMMEGGTNEDFNTVCTLLDTDCDMVAALSLCVTLVPTSPSRPSTITAGSPPAKCWTGSAWPRPRPGR